jgi:ParB family chromosome partitioning protein
MFTQDQSTSTNGSESCNAMVGRGTPAIMGKNSVYKRLGDLFISGANVRKSGAPVDIPVLAALISAQGLLSALHISAERDSDGNPTGRFGVEAGGRRYRALMLRVEQGKAILDDLIECKEVDEGCATEVSLTENLGQVAMPPADEFTAFQEMVNQGRTLNAIAERFGKSVLEVKRRLRLANVAPKLMDIFRKGGMSLDQVMALAATEDQERQLQTWNSLPDHNRHVSTIKRKLAEDTVGIDDPRVKLIGFKNYLAAGGTTDVDLFTTGQAKTLNDAGLVELLVGEAMTAVAEGVEIEGWAWVVQHSDFGYEERCLYEDGPKHYKPETKEQTQQRKALEARFLELEDELDKMDTDEVEWEKTRSTETMMEVVESQLAALKEATLDLDAYDKTQYGAVVSFQGDDGIVVLRGMVLKGVKGSGGGSTGYVRNKAEKAEFPEKLMLNLTSHRTAAIQASMLTNQAVSLAALANTFAFAIFKNYANESTLKISLRECRGDLSRNSDTVDGSRAVAAIDAATEQWTATLPKEKGEWFAWFLAQPQAIVLDFIVYASAVSTNATSTVSRADAGGAKLAEALELDMSQWWEATPETYFDLVPKSKLAVVVGETGDAELVKALDKMKKDAAVAHTVEVSAGKAWLPAPLRKGAMVPLQVSRDADEVGGGDDEVEDDDSED